jgi:hypothetical protein
MDSGELEAPDRLCYGEVFGIISEEIITDTLVSGDVVTTIS